MPKPGVRDTIPALVVSGQNSCACPVDPTIVRPIFKLGNYEVDEVVENKHVQRDVKFEVRGKKFSNLASTMHTAL